MASFSSTSPQHHHHQSTPMSSSPPPTTLALPAPTPKSGSKPKSAPVPWSHQETLALIQAYQDKWYSLKKGQLKAFQWEEVAASVASGCGFPEPSKTSTQCRHKIEKLRKRYRAEMPKPYPESWPYFELMDQMERGPNATPVSVRPVSVFKSPASAPDRNGGGGGGNSNPNPNPRYANLHSNSNSPGYYSHHSNNNNNNNNNNVSNNRVDDDGGDSDESDEEWNLEAARRRNKSKSINNIVRTGDVRGGVRSVARGFGSESDRFAGVLRNQVNGNRKRFYDGYDSDEDEEDDDDLEEETEKWTDEEEEEESGGGGRELAARIRGFAESFMRMENQKIEMMRETERVRMEMEKKRMDMILGAQKKIVDTIGRAFGACNNKRPRMGQDS